MTNRCELPASSRPQKCTDSSLLVPAISHSVDDISDLDVELDESELHNILTDTVRKQYYRYLQNVLENNYAKACPPPNQASPDLAVHCRRLEERAIRSCMILHLYRRSILKIIGQIRCDTEQRKRFDLHAEPLRTSSETPAPCVHDATTQTEDVIAAKAQAPHSPIRESLHARLKRIARDHPALDGRTKPHQHPSADCKRHKDHHNLMASRSAHHHHHHRSISQAPKQPTPQPLQITPVVMPITPQPTISDDDDDLFKQMSEICGNIDESYPATVPTDLVAEIFGEEVPTTGAGATTDITASARSDEPAPHQTLATNGRASSDTLLNSLWPCELHMQRLRLQAALSQYASGERGWEHTERLRWRFRELFGDEDDADDYDVFAPYSPTLELNPVLMASCKRRIAPWIVRSLMAPLSEGMIANRFLFKRLAKHLAERIIVVDQYPDEHLIRDVVAEFFCMHPLVRTLEDIQ